jgi:hypothetical protein
MKRLLYRHCKALRYCDIGIEDFLAQHGMTLVEFMQNGVSAELALSWDDAMVNRALEYAQGDPDNG